MRTKNIQISFLLSFLAVLMCYSAESLAWSGTRTAWNDSSDPNALYGTCNPSGFSGMKSKSFHVYAARESLENVIAVTVLICQPYTGPGVTAKVPCQANSPYDYCLRNQNDGLGNDIMLGVVKRDGIAKPTGQYTGCGANANLHTKLRLVKYSYHDPRMLKGIVTLSCGTATATNETKPVTVACPAGPDPYSYCISTPNDGYGNAVTLGIIAVQDSGDPYGLYGECHASVKKGFKSKSTIITSLGLPRTDVRAIDIVQCSEPATWGWGQLPSSLKVGACSESPSLAYAGSAYSNRYDYCIWGIDKDGIGLEVGVIN